LLQAFPLAALANGPFPGHCVSCYRCSFGGKLLSMKEILLAELDKLSDSYGVCGIVDQ